MTQLKLGFAVAIVFLASSVNAQQCAWRTVDNFLAPTTTAANASAVFAGRNSVYVGGTSTDSVTGHWVVRKLSRNVWSTVDDFIYSIGLRGHPQSITRSGRTMVVAGGANTLSNAGPWLTRRSVDRGQSWTTTDTFSNPAGSASFAEAAVTDANGTLLVGGPSNVAGVGYHWVVRQSTNNGATWSTADDVAPLTSSAGVKGLALASNGDVFAAGYNWDGDQYRWQVRRRAAGSMSWAQVDDFVPSGTLPMNTTFAFAVAAGGGTVMVVGTYARVNESPHWLVRKSTNSGATWTAADDFVSSGACAPHAVAYDPGRSIWYVAGRCLNGSAYEWIVRKSANNGTNWTTDDTFQFTPGATSDARGIAVSSRGRVYVVGRGDVVTNGTTTSRWIVRERPCP